MAYNPPTPSVVSTVNSTTAALGVGAVFTGTSEDITAYASITVSLFAGAASATDGLSMQQSSDGSNWDSIDVYTVPASTGKTFGTQISLKFFRVVYTNGGTTQGTFRLQTIFHEKQMPTSVVRPADARSNDNDMQEVCTYLNGFNGTSWDRLRTTIANGLSVDVTRLSALVAGTAVIGKVGIAGKLTYKASAAAVLVAAVTADKPWFVIYGSSTKTIKVQRIRLSGMTLTAVQYLNIGVAKYSTAPSGGTATTFVQIPLNATSAAATASLVQGYTAVPTTGTRTGFIGSLRTLAQAATATSASLFTPAPIVFDFRCLSEADAVTLNGTAQGIGLEWIATVPASAVTCMIDVEWTEE